MDYTFVFSDHVNGEREEEIPFSDLQSAVVSAVDALAEIALENHAGRPSEMTVTIKRADVSEGTHPTGPLHRISWIGANARDWPP